jgi:ketosteroid isomerase-like protein
MNETLTRYFKAMQHGPDGLAELISLFTDDAVYLEPFTPGGGKHVGRETIAEWLAQSQTHAPPELRLTIERVDAHEDEIEVVWECQSPAFSQPSRGNDRFTLRDGKIARLETTVTQPPQLR